MDVLPAATGEAFASDFEEGFAEIDEIDCVKFGDGEELVHGFNVGTWTNGR